MTVLDVIQRSTEFLARKGVDSPRLQAELLLAHQLKLPRMRLYLDFQRELTTAELDPFRELVRRRGLREPLQQIAGTTSFCGLEIAVNRDVLIPRPETELLAERGWSFLNARLDASPSPLALDFGTGTACLAIALAVKCPAARVRGLDSSPGALAQAAENLRRHQLTERVQLLQGDGFAALPGADQFDLILSNPPYIPTGEWEALQPEVRDFEPRTALDGGPDGLDFFRRLAAEAGAFLGSGGRLMLEFGDGQAGHLRGLFEEQKWVVEDIVEDYTHRPRIFIARKAG